MKKNIIEIRVSKFETETEKYFTIGSNSKDCRYRIIGALVSEKFLIVKIKMEIKSILSDWAPRMEELIYSYDMKFIFNKEDSFEGKARFGNTRAKNFLHFEYPKWKRKVSEEEQKMFFRAVNELTDNAK
jgi:hypothetical protein